MSLSRLRVVVVGVGRFGALHVRAWLEAGADVVGLCDRDVDRLVEVAARHGVGATDDDLAKLLERCRPDVVVVATDEDSHAPIAELALSMNAHVFVEKPLALTAADAWRIHDLANEADREVVVGQISRFLPAVLRMRHQIRSGVLGELAALRLRRDFSRSWFEAFGDRVHPVWESCIHDIDLAVFLADSPVTRVSAVQPRGESRAFRSVVSAHLELAGGAVATVESAWLVPDSAPQTVSGALELSGTIAAEAEAHCLDGVLRLGQASDLLTEWLPSTVGRPDLMLWPDTDGRVEGALRAEIAHAMAICRGEDVPRLVPLRQVCWGVAAAEAMVTSLAERRTVDVPTREAGGE